jgi:hypothetical protein
MNEIYEVEEGRSYVSKRTKTLVLVKSIARHAQDCSRPMVVYTNLKPTDDSPAGTVWVLDYDMFLNRFGPTDSRVLELPKGAGKTNRPLFFECKHQFMKWPEAHSRENGEE